MSWQCCEPTLEDILSDPIVVAIMEADGVDPRELHVMLRRTAHKRDAAETDVVAVSRPNSSSESAGADPT